MNRHHLPIVFLDTETTGLESDKGDELIEVAAVKWNGAGYFNYSTLVRADHATFQWPAMEAHHVRPNDTCNAPLRSDVIVQLRAFIDTFKVKHIIAHSAAFDRGFLPELDDLYWIDTLKLVRRAWQEAPNHKNFTLFHGLALNRFWVGSNASHRALTDVLATSELFDAALDQLGLRGDCSIDDVVKLYEEPFDVEMMWYGPQRGRRITDLDDWVPEWVLRKIAHIDPDTKRALYKEMRRRRRKHGPPVHLAS